MSQANQDHSKLQAQEAKFVAWLQTILVETDLYRVTDESENKMWENGAKLMPVEDRRLLRKLMDEHAIPMGNLPTMGFSRVRLPVHKYGAANEINAARFLHFSDIVMERYFDVLELHQQDPVSIGNFAVWISEKALNNDSTLFFQIAKLLERREQGTLNKTSPSDLGLKTTPGRQKQPYDLEETFPLAALQLLELRVSPRDFNFESHDDLVPARPYYITRRELTAEIVLPAAQRKGRCGGDLARGAFQMEQ